jgi:hypothetical protein
MFYQELAAAGLKVHAFNLAADGLRPPEDSFILDEALSGRTAPLTFVVVEGNSLAMRIGEEDFGSDRMTYWHDTKRMMTFWRRTWSHSVQTPPTLREAILDVWRNLQLLPGHVQHWLANALRPGRGADLFDETIGVHKRPPFLSEPLGALHDGFIPRSKGPMDASESADYSKALAKVLHRRTPRLDSADSESQRHVEEMSAMVRSHGARLVILAPPTLTPEVFHPLSPDIIFLDFSDPQQYPQLFDPAVRLDSTHTNDVGSKLLSHLVAHALAVRVTGSPESGQKLPHQ